MKKYLVTIFFIFGLASSTNSQPLQVPQIIGHVNDYAGMLSHDAINEFENLLEDHKQQTSNQVAVLIISTLQDEILEDYSVRVAKTWKLGQADKDNGVLLLIVHNDRKIRIEVGYGLEGSLPDLVCGRIIRNEIAPRFRQGDYSDGVRTGINAILGAIRGTYVSNESNSKGWGSYLIELLLIPLIFFGIKFLFKLFIRAGMHTRDDLHDWYLIRTSTIRSSWSKVSSKSGRSDRHASSSNGHSSATDEGATIFSDDDFSSGGDRDSSGSEALSGGGGSFGGGGASGSW